ncbi:hypothetical protein PPS11_08010 [Pseudomonas putida S11]|nr:hypothetical protein PPS11_08010 [Pseudomonas putida S11]
MLFPCEQALPLSFKLLHLGVQGVFPLLGFPSLYGQRVMGELQLFETSLVNRPLLLIGSLLPLQAGAVPRHGGLGIGGEALG